jgi:hypothetical protein
MHRLAISLILGAALSLTLSAQPKKKKILAIGAVAGYQHDSVSHSLATIEKSVANPVSMTPTSGPTRN